MNSRRGDARARRTPAIGTLRQALELHLSARPDQTYLVSPEAGYELTYRELAHQAAALDRWLQMAGLRKGDKVGLFLPNGLQTVVLFLGAMLGGYVVAPLNLLLYRGQLAYVLEHCDCRVLFTSRAMEAQLAEALAEVHRRFEIVVIDPDAPTLFLEDRLPPARPAAIAPEDPALLIYTSGTTGKPKGALLSHRNLVAGATAVANWHRLGPGDRCLSSLPLYHVNGQVIATITPFVSGGSTIAPHRFSVSTWWNIAERHGATWINMVPTIIAYLLNSAKASTRDRLPKVRFGRSASAPLPPEQHRAFEETFGIPVIEAMGMTESASVAFINPHDSSRRKYGSPGLPCGVEAKIIDPASGAALPDLSQGEICLRGPNVMQGYYKAASMTDEALDAAGWLRTGDLGYRDRDGFYFITGRLKELISKGGEKIAPREIDEALLRHPAVLEAAAVGISDANYGQEVAAFVVLKPGATATPDALRAFCLAELGPFKTPKKLRIVAELPKGPSGKVQRLKLLELG